MPVVFNQKKKKKHSKYFKVFLLLGGNGLIWGGETLYMGRNILLAPTACICAPSRERDGMDCKLSFWIILDDVFKKYPTYDTSHSKNKNTHLISVVDTSFLKIYSVPFLLTDAILKIHYMVTICSKNTTTACSSSCVRVSAPSLAVVVGCYSNGEWQWSSWSSRLCFSVNKRVSTVK